MGAGQPGGHPDRHLRPAAGADVAAVVVPEVRPAQRRDAVGRLRQLQEAGRRPGLRRGDQAHHHLHGVVRARHDARRAVHRRRAEPVGALHLRLPDGRLHHDGGVDHLAGHHLPVADRPRLRSGQRGFECRRRTLAAVPGVAVAGAVRDRGDDDLGLDGFLGDRVSGCAARCSAGAARGGRDRRGVARSPGSAPSPCRCSARRTCSCSSG